MTLNLLELSLDILGSIINNLEHEKDFLSFILTCTVFYNCFKLERVHLRINPYRKISYPNLISDSDDGESDDDDGDSETNNINDDFGDNVRNKYVHKLLPFILKNFGRLQSLKLEACYTITDVTCLSDFTKLKSLELSGCYSITNVSFAIGLTQLTNMKLSNCWKLTDVSGLGMLQKPSFNYKLYIYKCDI